MSMLDDQIIEPVGYDFGLSRRTFVQVLGSGLVIAAAAPVLGQERQRGGRGRGFGAPAQVPVDARLHIGNDGVITVLTGKVEGGQGSRAELTQAAAEELRVSVQNIRLIMADTDLTPDDGITAGSRTTPGTMPGIRSAAAAARQLLVQLAAKKWDVNGKELEVRDGTVVSGERRLAYADLAKESAEALKAAPGTDVEVTKAGDWKVLGTGVARPNGRELVTGKHHYPYDTVRPGMMYGKVLRPISYGAKVRAIDEAAAGVKVVRDGDFVGVVAPTTHAANKALAALEKSVRWDRPPHTSSKELYDQLKIKAKGDIGVGSDEKAIRVTYTVAYAQHAPMEPRSATAEWDNGKVTVWTSTQNPFGVRREVAGAFHIPETSVRVIVPDFGGGFGGKHTGEAAVEAARLAQAAGKPVALRWTREEEFTWASFRPAAVIDIAATVDEKGEISTWNFVNINSGASSIESPYRGKNKSQYVQSDPPLRHGSYRALAATANNFARESFMDELAARAGRDPLEYRLAQLDNPRLRAVLEEAAKQFKWSERRSQKSEGRAVGLACGIDKGGYVAACAEISVDRAKGTIRVHRVHQAFECGAITNPDNLRSQVTGGVLMGLGPALREGMQFEEGQIQNASFWKYEVPRFADVPEELEVHLINRPDLPSSGAGETPLIAIAPAIGNALFHATGIRSREMPLRLT